MKQSFSIDSGCSLTILPLLIAFCSLFSSCGKSGADARGGVVMDSVGYPSVVYHDGMYYLTGQLDNSDDIVLFASPGLGEDAEWQRKLILGAKENTLRMVYSPDLQFIDGKWYIFYDSDNGVNTDTHQIYVLENPSPDPMKGTWTKRGPIITNAEWNFSIHPNFFQCNGKLYMLWSGWQKRRVESETQCIFIAEMENPWTLKSERILLSLPEYEWERQWINSDGSRSAYPIFVNENPQAVISPDGKKVVVLYSASGIWTEFISLGMLYAPTDADLLDPRSWTKVPEPLFTPSEETPDKRSSNVVIVNNPDEGKSYIVYESRIREHGGTHCWLESAEIQWDAKSLPILTHP